MSDMLRPILWQALKHPKRVAVIDDRRTWRYLDLLGGAMFLARHLNRLGAAKHVGVMLPTSGAFSMAMLAAWLTDRVIVPINYLLGPEDRQFIADDSGIDTLLTANVMLEHIGPAPNGVNVVKVDELEFKGVPPFRLPPMGRSADRLAAILYTSGTSGRPKGVMLTHRNLRSNTADSIRHADLKEADVFLGVLPQFHCFGLTALTLIPLSMGARVVYTARFIPARLIKLIEEHRPQIIMAIPSMYNALANVKKATANQFESVKIAVSGAEPLSQDVHQRFMERFNVNILEGYGLTETSPVVCWSTPQRNQRGAVGPVLPNVDVRIIDDQGNRLGSESEGEITIKGPNVMAGYYNQPQLTDEVIDSDGYFRTGDIGKIDREGLVHITGRLKEMMIVGGENVFPREIEEVIASHSSVSAVGVVGKTDPSRGEVPVAFVEIAEGSAFDDAALRAHCREHLAGFKVPREIYRIEKLPRSPTGKVLRRKLAEQVSGG